MEKTPLTPLIILSHDVAMLSLHFIYASTSGHTEHVVDTLVRLLSQTAADVTVTKQRVEHAALEDLRRADVVVLASGTWNFGGVEGQLNERMHRYLFEDGEGIDLTGQRLAFISLGDERYYHTVRCTEKFMRFLRGAHATMPLVPLILVNEPYGQEDRVMRWGEKLLAALRTPVPPHTAA